VAVRRRAAGFGAVAPSCDRDASALNLFRTQAVAVDESTSWWLKRWPT
jgi:hypothetical protein